MTETHGVHDYDLIVVGSGSGNSLIDEEWKDKKVTIVDGGVFGGTCLNKGCIPTKMFAYPATTAVHGLDDDRLGVSMERTDVRWRASVPTTTFSSAVIAPKSRMFWKVRATPAWMIR